MQRQEGRLDVSQTKSTAQNARTFRFVGARSRRMRTTRKTPRLQETYSPRVEQIETFRSPALDLEHEGDFSTMVDIDSFLDNFHPDTHAELEPGEIAVQLPSGPSTEQLWTSSEIETCPPPDVDRNSLTTVHREGTAVLGESPVSPLSSLLFDPDGLLSFDWSSLGSDDGHAMLETTFSLATYLGGDPQQEILLKSCM